MKTNIHIFLLSFLLLFLHSCRLEKKGYSQDVFEKVKLNSNKIPNGFKPAFREIQGQLKAGNLIYITPENKIVKVNASDYVQKRYVPMFDQDIKAITNIEPDKETLEILKAALDLFYYADSIYKFDFPHIARMIDDGRPQEDIDQAIADLEANKSEILNEKYNKVHDLIMPYADKHGIEYKIIELPQPLRYN